MSCSLLNVVINELTKFILRVHRLGQTREVHVYRLICRDTVEERLLLLQDRKRSLSQKAIGGEGARGPEARLSLEDLKSFFV